MNEDSPQNHILHQISIIARNLTQHPLLLQIISCRFHFPSFPEIQTVPKLTKQTNHLCRQTPPYKPRLDKLSQFPLLSRYPTEFKLRSHNRQRLRQAR